MLFAFKNRGVLANAAQFIIFALTALAVTGVWTWAAKTQEHVSYLRRSDIVANAYGLTPAPFVTRRLAVDTGRLIAYLVPAKMWDSLSSLLYGNKPIAKVLNDQLNWTPHDLPILASTSFVIWWSVLGFMFVSQALIHHFYMCANWVPPLLALVLGFGLLTGCGAGHAYDCYPYDYPNVFIFSLTFLGIVRGAWWTPLAMLAAAYSKETSVLLILLFALLRWKDRSSMYWITLAAMLVGYATVRYVIYVIYVPPEMKSAGYWFAGRNAMMVARWVVYDFWILVVYAVAAYRISRIWPSVPRLLRLAAPVFVVIFVAGFVKGWFEERRQYLEAYTVFCLIFLQWIFAELGLTRYFSPRVEEQHDALPSRIT